MQRQVTVRGVGKRYPGSAQILAGVDLDLPAGRVVAVTGGNGSGKSTLLKIIAGVLTPTTGTVTGRPRRSAYVPERFPSHQRMPALSYLVHMGRIQGLPARRARARALDLLERLQLTGGPDAPLRRLSKGNAQKVAVAQALLTPPALLILDEPWSGLDAAAHEVLATLITEAAAEGGAVIFTDHREAVVDAQASAVYHLARGRLTAAAPPGVVHTPAAAPPGMGHPSAAGPPGMGHPSAAGPPGMGHPSAAGPPPAGVQPSSATLAVVHLAGMDRAGAGAGDVSWQRMPGVRSVRRTGPRTVSVRVSQDRCDRLLVAAIQAGWSVLRVER